MKKLLWAMLILCMGALVYARLNQQAGQMRDLTIQSRAECKRFANRINEVSAAESALRAQMTAQQARLSQASASAASGPTETKLLAMLPNSQSKAWRNAASPELRQRLGIGWDNSPDYILVSKEALKSVWFPGIDDHGTPSSTLCDVLALTDEERAAVEKAFQHAEAIHAAWFKTAVERVAPAGDILAEYQVPANPDLAKQIEQEKATSLTKALGAQRVKLLERFSEGWMTAHGDIGQHGIRFTVHNTIDRQPPLWVQIEAIGGSSGASNVQPGSFPELFRGAFPGGWSELAQREGFPLPKEFDSPTPEEQ